MQNNDYQLPGVNLLSVPPIEEVESTAEILRKRDVIMQALRDFDIAGEVPDYTVGPRVTHFEITILPSVEFKEIEDIADNIAMDLGVSRIRLVPPDRRRQIVGLEVENYRQLAVFAQPMLMSKKWGEFPSALPLLIGKTWNDAPVIDSLTTAPHILISGATGTGKSVCMNSLIAGLLLKFRPNELKFVLIDPKIIEFEPYGKLPHLFAPVINDTEKAAGALHWIVAEIERRYEVLALAHAKTIAEFNRRDDSCGETSAKMPYLVVVIDELADFMMSDVKRDIENFIARIAQRGRAAGVHIVIATTRPSPDIIPCIIKANFPTRFCFQVRSNADSRVVINTAGAEQLLGRGDMLFMSPSNMVIERVQGAYITDEDLLRLVENVCRQAKPEFSPGLIKAMEEYFPEEGKPLPRKADFLVVASKFIREDDDDAMRRAVGVILLDRRASVSYLQRRLKIVYNRSLEILDELEKRKLVSPVREDGRREILANFSQE